MGKMKATAVLLMVVPAFQSFGAAAQTWGKNIAKIKKQASKIPLGTKIEVKLLQKDSQKISDMLTNVSDESIEMSDLRESNSVTETIAFADIQSMKAKKEEGKGRSKKFWITVGSLLFVAALFYATVKYRLNWPS